MRKVLMMPTPQQALNDTTNSINAIVLRLQKALPPYGYELTENLAEADLVAGHAGQANSNIQVDVCHCHGLYPSAYPNLIQQWHLKANQDVVNNLMVARVITTPSEWVADILRRDLHAQPKVIPWAIDVGEWEPTDHQEYVLWNKTRVDGVCDPIPVTELAKRASRVTFVTTYADNPPANVKVIGRQPYERMRDTIRHAGVYLATTKETFGIGILEAMASGIPVLGFKHGNVTQLVTHGVNGYIVEPGDYDGLAQGLQYCLENRAVLGRNGRYIASAYTWERVAGEIASVYDGLTKTKDPDPKVSVVIPFYNYGRYIRDAILSVVQQETSFEVELIIVNDGSESKERQWLVDTLVDDEIIHMLAQSNIKSEINFIDQPNGGVASARNRGIQESRGKFIVCLDADDRLGNPQFLQMLADTMDRDRGLGITFTGLQMIGPDGALGNVSQWPDGFSWELQIQGRNQVPTCCMFQREAWRRAGGYKAQYTPAEDAELWTRIVALGYRAAQVTTAPWFQYRWHDGSLSGDIREGKRPEPDWRTDKPWINDKLFPLAANGIARNVRNYDKPKVSVIIPVADYHVPYLGQALDSVEKQTERYWECLVINDTGSPLPGLAPYPWVKVLDTGGNRGAGAARNIGIKAANAPLITFLDADDMFLPRFLEATLQAYQRTGRYVYTDWISLSKNGLQEPHTTPDFVTGDVFKKPTQHSICVLLKREWALKVGGFDETMTSWEDVNFFMQLGAAGICGTRVPEPLHIYRYTTGQRRENGEAIRQQLIDLLRNRYEDYIEGRKMCGCTNQTPGKQTTVNGKASVAGKEGEIQLTRVSYNGPAGNIELYGSVTLKYYGRRAGGDTFYIDVRDQLAQPEVFTPIMAVFEEKPATPIPPPPVPIQEGIPA